MKLRVILRIVETVVPISTINSHMYIEISDSFLVQSIK